MYLAHEFTNSLKVGEKYKDITPHKQINFIKHNKIHKNRELINKYIIINENNKDG